MKRFAAIVLLLTVLLSFGACAKTDYKDVTPALSAIERIYIQKTVVDEQNNYTYKEKLIEGEKEIRAFCDLVDAIHFTAIDPVEFPRADFLIVFEGAKKHKLIFLEDEIIYDGLAYKSVKGSLKQKMTDLYDSLTQVERDETSKLFG